MSTDGIRLNKFISTSGYCSRREADKLIESNRVNINGKRPDLGVRVYSGDEVTVDGMRIVGEAADKKDRIYIVYNKPVGITCTTEKSVKGNIVDAIDHDERIFPIGRLDKPSEGLILLTNDGDIVNKILRGENAHSKEYLVVVNKTINNDFAEKMSKGVPILNTVTKPCKVSIQSKTAFKIVLTQGLNRQIRRMCEYLGYEVIHLQRLRIMNIDLGRLKPGQWRNVTREEMAELNKLLEHSSNESSKKNKPKQVLRNKVAKQKQSNKPSLNNKGKTTTKHHPKSKKDKSNKEGIPKNKTSKKSRPAKQLGKKTTSSKRRK